MSGEKEKTLLKNLSKGKLTMVHDCQGSVMVWVTMGQKPLLKTQF